MTDYRAASSQLLTQLLSINSPELGARLKQRLNAAFIASGLGGFDEKSFGFAKFADYLLRVHGELVCIERREGCGDIFVSLRSASSKRILTALSPNCAKTGNAPVIRSDVWQAFTNPDSERKRFFHKQTGKVVHYLNGQASAERSEVEASPELFLEIIPISKDTQAEWMKDFLDAMPLPLNEKEVLQALIAKPYSSTVNVTFSRALGSHSMAWRNYRTERVMAFIQKWASEKSVPLSKLHVTTVDTLTGAIQSAASNDAEMTMRQIHGAQPTDQLPPRQQVLKLLELLSDDDIMRLVIPTLLSTILIKSRM